MKKAIWVWMLLATGLAGAANEGGHAGDPAKMDFEHRAQFVLSELRAERSVEASLIEVFSQAVRELRVGITDDSLPTAGRVYDAPSRPGKSYVELDRKKYLYYLEHRYRFDVNLFVAHEVWETAGYDYESEITRQLRFDEHRYDAWYTGGHYRNGTGQTGVAVGGVAAGGVAVGGVAVGGVAVGGDGAAVGGVAVGGSGGGAAVGGVAVGGSGGGSSTPRISDDGDRHESSATPSPPPIESLESSSAARLAQRAEHDVDGLRPHVDPEVEYVPYLLPIRSAAERAYYIATTDGDLSRRTKNALKDLRARITDAEPAISSLLKREDTASALAGELTAIQHEIENRLR